MVQLSTRPSIRACAREIIDILDRHGGSVEAAQAELAEPIQAILARPDLLDLGVKRDGNHVIDSQWLYYDYELLMFLFMNDKGVPVPVHNHGTWEIMGVYRGAFKYTMYRREDDLTRPYYAELAVVEDRVILPNDLTVCPPPPHDVHGFTALTDDSYMVALVGGHYAPVRQYYQPAQNYYIERGQQDWRLGGRR